MKLVLSFFRALCATEEFVINGVDADYEDFGEQYDREPECAQEYGCGNMRFTRRQPTREILAKYHITKEEYATIAEALEDGLSFGDCGWCV